MAMRIGPTRIEDTFAEAFRMSYARVIITADDEGWLDAAAREFTGYATSVIACDVEAGIDHHLSPEQSPDGRPGLVVLLFGFSVEALAEAVPQRAGQCLMTCPTTAAIDGLPAAEARIPFGKHLRYFGDGFQKSKQIDGRRYWRVPVMDGEFLIEESLGVERGVGGGNLILQAIDRATATSAARRAVAAMGRVPGTITPFPGGVVRSGSKVGSRYERLRASTNEAYCPTLRGRINSALEPEAGCAYEMVVDGVSEEAVAEAMKRGMQAAAGAGVLYIGAANFGGKLGKFQFALRDLLDE